MYVPRDTCMRTRTRAYVLMHTCTHTHTCTPTQTHTHTHYIEKHPPLRKWNYPPYNQKWNPGGRQSKGGSVLNPGPRPRDDPFLLTYLI